MHKGNEIKSKHVCDKKECVPNEASTICGSSPVGQERKNNRLTCDKRKIGRREDEIEKLKAQITRRKSTLKQGKAFAWKDKDDVATLEFLFERALPIAEGNLERMTLDVMCSSA